LADFGTRGVFGFGFALGSTPGSKAPFARFFAHQSFQNSGVPYVNGVGATIAASFFCCAASSISICRHACISEGVIVMLRGLYQSRISVSTSSPRVGARPRGVLLGLIGFSESGVHSIFETTPFSLV